MIKKLRKYFKISLSLLLIYCLTIPSYATLSSADGSAFVTKAEFDALAAEVNSRLTTFEAGINSKIDSQVTSYLDRNGIWSAKTQVLGTTTLDLSASNFTGDWLSGDLYFPNQNYGFTSTKTGLCVVLFSVVPKSEGREYVTGYWQNTYAGSHYNSYSGQMTTRMALAWCEVNSFISSGKRYHTMANGSITSVDTGATMKTMALFSQSTLFTNDSTSVSYGSNSGSNCFNKSYQLMHLPVGGGGTYTMMFFVKKGGLYQFCFQFVSEGPAGMLAFHVNGGEGGFKSQGTVIDVY